MTTQDRISSYLSNGGLFNPEHVDAKQVRDLLIDCRDDLKTSHDENHQLRVMCAFAHAGTSIYADDGELQDSRDFPWIDWRREPVSVIKAKLADRAIRGMQHQAP